MFNPVGMPMYGGMNMASQSALKTGILSKINWSSLLSNTQKTLNVVNQAIPLYYQVKPVFSNIRNISKITKEFTKSTSDNNVRSSANKNTNININKNNGTLNPTFFI